MSEYYNKEGIKSNLLFCIPAVMRWNTLSYNNNYFGTQGFPFKARFLNHFSGKPDRGEPTFHPYYKIFLKISEINN